MLRQAPRTTPPPAWTPGTSADDASFELFDNLSDEQLYRLTSACRELLMKNGGGGDTAFEQYGLGTPAFWSDMDMDVSTTDGSSVERSPTLQSLMETASSTPQCLPEVDQMVSTADRRTLAQLNSVIPAMGSPASAAMDTAMEFFGEFGFDDEPCSELWSPATTNDDVLLPPPPLLTPEMTLRPPPIETPDSMPPPDLTANDSIPPDLGSEKSEKSASDIQSRKSIRRTSPTQTGVATSSRYAKRSPQWWQYNLTHRSVERTALLHRCLNPTAAAAKRSTTDRRRHDPVFDRAIACASERNLGLRIAHAGKARVGDGNDLTARPDRLRDLKCRLDRLNAEMSKINSLLVSLAVGCDARVRVQREKNRLASRICRLKRLAQHEANKILLGGLDKEHDELEALVALAAQMAMQRIDEMRGGGGTAVSGAESSLVNRLEGAKRVLLKTHCEARPEAYVNEIIDNVDM